MKQILHSETRSGGTATCGSPPAPARCPSWATRSRSSRCCSASTTPGYGERGVAALLLAAAVPTIVAAPWAGRVVDRNDSRRLLVTCGLAQAALCVALAFTASLVATLALVACLQAVQAVAGPGWQALVPAIVGEEETGRAVRGMQSLTFLAGVAGPAVAGLPGRSVRDGARPLLLDAATFVVLAAAAAPSGPAAGDAPPTPDRSRALLDGLRLVRADALLGPLTAGLVAFVIAGESTNVVEVFLVRDSSRPSRRPSGCSVRVRRRGCLRRAARRTGRTTAPGSR